MHSVHKRIRFIFLISCLPKQYKSKGSWGTKSAITCT